MNDQPNTGQPLPNAAQIAAIEARARELFTKWVEATGLRRVAAELVFKGHPVADPVKTARELHAFLLESQKN